MIILEDRREDLINNPFEAFHVVAACTEGRWAVYSDNHWNKLVGNIREFKFGKLFI